VAGKCKGNGRALAGQWYGGVRALAGHSELFKVPTDLAPFASFRLSHR